MATKDTKTDGVDVAAILAENEALKANQVAQQAQNDQVLDALIELQDTVKRLEAGQGQTKAAEAYDATSEMDAELAELTKEFADYPMIDMLERRALVGADANNELRLVDEPGLLEDPDGEHRYWKLRWFNFAIEGRAGHAAKEAYMKVAWKELRDSEGIATSSHQDEFVRQGDKGLEVLHKIPLKLFVYKKKRDAARHQGLLTSEQQMRDHVANRVAGLAGSSGQNADQAGSFVHGRRFSLSITKGETERFTA